MPLLPTLVGYILFGLAACHAWLDAPRNRLQRILLLLTLLGFGTLIEYMGVSSGGYTYPREPWINLGVVPLSVSLAWVGIIYSVLILAERLELPTPLRILATTLIAISLDWGMDPVAVYIGAWKWHSGGSYFGVPVFNFVGWFFIPIAYLIAYGLAWNRTSQRPRLLNIHQVDAEHSWGRKLYTLLGVLPVAIVLLRVTTQPFILIEGIAALPLVVMVIWAVLCVAGATAILLWRGTRLRRSCWFDLLPPCTLAYIGLSYAFFGFTAGRVDLGLLMLATGIPLWLALLFTLPKQVK
ncbi:MAG: carotenoid biosynthesis protein [Chloroflexota bacterium]